MSDHRLPGINPDGTVSTRPVNTPAQPTGAAVTDEMVERARLALHTRTFMVNTPEHHVREIVVDVLTAALTTPPGGAGDDARVEEMVMPDDVDRTEDNRDLPDWEPYLVRVRGDGKERFYGSGEDWPTALAMARQKRDTAALARGSSGGEGAGRWSSPEREAAIERVLSSAEIDLPGGWNEQAIAIIRDANT